jgi:hypothetical protein
LEQSVALLSNEVHLCTCFHTMPHNWGCLTGQRHYFCAISVEDTEGLANFFAVTKI